MEMMEKKKLLLVAVSIGVILVIVVGAAIMVSKPGSGDIVTPVVSSMDSAYSRSANTDLATLSGDAFRGLQDPNEVSPVQETYIANNGSDVTVKTVINVPAPSTAAVPDAKPVPVAKSAPAVKPQVEPVRAKPSTTESKKTYRDFWVQAGSFSTRDRADGVKSTLGTKGISAIVTNQEINGNTYYRVRVGPYTSQNEADYWLAMIKSIDGFQESQIWESRSFR